MAEGDRAKGCRPFSFVCLTDSVVGEKKKGGGIRGGVKSERETA